MAASAAWRSATDTLHRTARHAPSPIRCSACWSSLLVMGGLFWTLFALATIPMDLIEATFAHLGDWVATTLPEGPVRALVADGIIGGIAGSVVFLPQICLLFFLISLLEDTGYLARAAFVMDRRPAPVRPAGTRVRAAALELRLCAAGDHVDATDSGPARSAGDDSRRAAHELLGATAGLCAADQPAVRRSAALRRPRVRGLLSARQRWRRSARAFVIRRTLAEGRGTADGARVADVQVALARQRAVHRQGSGASPSCRRPAPSSWRSAS